MADFAWNEAALRVLLSGPGGGVARDLAKRAIRVQNRARQLCPVDTGRLRSSIQFRLGGSIAGLFADVGTNVVYARLVHDGTRPHVIFPSSAKALFWKGAPHPVPRVNHPGTRGVPFLRDAMSALR